MYYKFFLIFLGLILVSLGLIGVVVPGLPTTPFLLLSAGLFFYSSERLYEWILNHKLFGKYIRSFRENKAIPVHTKIKSIVLMWIMIFMSVFLFIDEPKLRIIIVSAGIIGTLVMLLIPGLKK